MATRRTTFSKFVIEQLRRDDNDMELAALLNDVQRAGKLIGAAVSRGPLDASGALVTTEVQMPGDPGLPLADAAHQILVSACEWGGQLCGMASSARPAPVPIPAEYPRGRYLLVVDPLDGGACADMAFTVGTFFSVLRAPEPGIAAREADFLQPGRALAAAGYLLFGSLSMMVVTLGSGVHGFTLDRDAGAYTLTHPNLRMDPAVQDLSIDASRVPHWEAPVRRYVEECTQAGGDVTARWSDSLVAELHRLLLRGGTLLCPRDTREGGEAVPPLLVFQAQAMAMLVEQAGGAASTGRGRVLDRVPRALHERVPLVLGRTAAIERIEALYAADDRGEMPHEPALFVHRSLFR
jgi:fructose-1,6-bisphosphatase